ncbi:MAG: 2-amino-4-hydroxy-6-hydroxymethyldihydropteridine diphosphokinase [Bryobacteraceae bacterium]
MKRVYLGLGSNLGGRERRLEEAIARLHGPDLRVVRISPVYETAPVDAPPQGWFLNLVVEAETGLFPRQLLARTASIERSLGRRRLISKGPRTIDIDILFYGDAVIDMPQLKIPHPRYAERRFVLVPMADLAPDFRDPVTRRTMRELLAAAPEQEIRPAAFRAKLRAFPG